MGVRELFGVGEKKTHILDLIPDYRGTDYCDFNSKLSVADNFK